jgi:hypothetical protein
MRPGPGHREMGARDLLHAAGVVGHDLCEVRFAAVLDDGCGDTIPARPGAYLIVTAGDERVVGIGSTGSGQKQTGTLAERMGTFVAAALGFPVKHSSGRRFWATRRIHGLHLRDLAVICLPTNDPRATEGRLFDAYEDVTGHLPLLCRARPRLG